MNSHSKAIFSFLLRLVHFTTHLPIVQLPKGIIAPLLGKMFYDDSRRIQKEYLFRIFIQHALIETVLSFLPELGDFVHERLSPRFQSHQIS